MSQNPHSTSKSSQDGTGRGCWKSHFLPRLCSRLPTSGPLPLIRGCQSRSRASPDRLPPPEELGESLKDIITENTLRVETWLLILKSAQPGSGPILSTPQLLDQPPLAPLTTARVSTDGAPPVFLLLAPVVHSSLHTSLSKPEDPMGRAQVPLTLRGPQTLVKLRNSQLSLWSTWGSQRDT